VPKVQDSVCEVPMYAIIPLLSKPTAYDPALEWNTDARYTRWSTYPFMLRDIAVWVPKGVNEEEILAVILGYTTDLLVRSDKFDEFEKEGRVSHAWHLVFQSDERTLTDAEIGGIMDTVTNALCANAGWEVR
jgi:phenylalanyl-tRNA synthetase beta subunit